MRSRVHWKLIRPGLPGGDLRPGGGPEDREGNREACEPRVITPGTVIDSSMVPSSAASYLMALCPYAKRGEWGIARPRHLHGRVLTIVPLSVAGLEGIFAQRHLGDRPGPARECIVSSQVNGETPAADRGRGRSCHAVPGRGVRNDHAFRCLHRALQRCIAWRVWVRREVRPRPGQRERRSATQRRPSLRSQRTSAAFRPHILAEHDAQCDHAAEPRSEREHSRRDEESVLLSSLDQKRPRWGAGA